MLKITNKKIIGVLVGCLGFNGLIWLIVNLFSLPETILEFSMGFSFALVLVCSVLLFIPESKRMNS